MNPILRLDETERKALQDVLRASPRVLHALTLLLLSVLPPYRVAELVGLALSTVYDRRKRWFCHGLASLGHQPRSGRPRRLTARLEARLLSTVTQSPRQWGFPTNLWTCQLLQKALQRRNGLRVSAETIRCHLHALKWSWKRPRHGPAHSDDPDTEPKLARLAEVQGIPADGHHVLYVDEADFRLLSPIRASWSPVGTQPVYTTPGNYQTLYAFGAYEPATRRFIYRVFHRKRCGEFQGFLEHLLKQFSGKLYLVLDNVRTHKAVKIQAFVEAHQDRLECVFLPTFSPQYNEPIERIWGTAKTRICGNECARDLVDLERRVRAGLTSLQQQLRTRQPA